MDRKAIIREYRERKPPMGVFRVLNTANGKAFVGASVDAPAMLNRIRAQLGFGSHPVKALQADWVRFGAEAFTFEVLDTLEPADEPGHDAAAELRVLEAMWLERLAPYGERGYNAPPSGGR